MSVTPTDSSGFSSGIPMAQLKLCKLNSGSIDLSVPAGTLVYLDATLSVCPSGFSARTDTGKGYCLYLSKRVSLFARRWEIYGVCYGRCCS